MRAIVRGLVVAAAALVAALPLSLATVSSASVRSAAPQGEAFSWGANFAGQLGNGTDSAYDDTLPGLVVPGANASDRWVFVGAGGTFSCGIDAAAVAYCWGDNGDGALGNGTTNYTSDDSAPAPLLPGDNSTGTWTLIDGGWNFNCGLGTNGAAYCWGKGSDGQLGTGSTGDDTLPAAVVPGAKPAGVPWTHLSMGYGSACGVSGGAAYCWGYNANGGLGNGNTTNSPSPVAVLGGHTWTHISTGEAHACGLTSSGEAYCWGRNGDGQLGDGATDDTSVPVEVAFAGTWTQIEAGSYNTCGVTVDAELYCWGANNNGQLGQGSTGPAVLTPLKVPGLGDIVDVALGEDFVCATTQTSMYCWGENQRGQIGNGTKSPGVSTPTEVVSSLFTGLSPRSMALGAYHVIALYGAPSPAPKPAEPPALASHPRAVSAEAGDRSAIVSWDGPESSGSFPVSHYLVTSTPSGRTCVVTAPALTCEVVGLTNGMVYTFTVKALTGAGWSAASTPSNAVVPRATAGPSIVVTGSRDDKRIEVSGSTTGLGMGAILNPWVRLAGQTSYAKGSAQVLVSMDGTFTWGRTTGKKVSVYMQTPDGSVRSNTVAIR